MTTATKSRKKPGPKEAQARAQREAKAEEQASPAEGEKAVEQEVPAVEDVTGKAPEGGPTRLSLKSGQSTIFVPDFEATDEFEITLPARSRTGAHLVIDRDGKKVTACNIRAEWTNASEADAVTCPYCKDAIKQKGMTVKTGR